MKLWADEFYDGRGRSIAICQDDGMTPVAMVYDRRQELAALFVAAPGLKRALELALEREVPHYESEDTLPGWVIEARSVLAELEKSK